MSDEALLAEARKRGLLPGGAPTASDDPLVTEAIKRGLLKGNTIQERARSKLGLKDYKERGTLLPLGQTAEGKLELAIPQAAIGMVESGMLPRHAMEGGAYTSQDALKAAMDYAVPFTMSRQPGRLGQPYPTKGQIKKAAPTTEQLRGAGEKAYQAVDASGVVVKPERGLDVMVDIEKALGKSGYDAKLHPALMDALGAMQKKLSDEGISIDDLQIMRRYLSKPLRSTAKELADERRLAEIVQDKLDDFIDNLGDADVIAGDTKNLAANLYRARTTWSAMRKSEAVENAVERASLHPSGLDKGLENEFRMILKNRKLSRGFTADEKDVMKQIVKGTTPQKFLRLLGKFSFGRSGLGGAMATGAGAVVGGPLGAMAAPAAAGLARGGAAVMSSGQTQFLRNLAASGGRYSPGGTGDIFMPAMPPLLGSTLPEDQRLIEEERLRKGLLMSKGVM